MSATHTSDANGILVRAWRFLHKPWHEKTGSLINRWSSLRFQFARSFLNIRMPVRLPFGAWWLPRKDNLGEPLLAGTFETNEIAFVGGFLQPGMTVLDLGAHHGVYTILASKRVAPGGRVFAFEPSPRKENAPPARDVESMLERDYSRLSARQRKYDGQSIRCRR